MNRSIPVLSLFLVACGGQGEFHTGDPADAPARVDNCKQVASVCVQWDSGTWHEVPDSWFASVYKQTAECVVAIEAPGQDIPLGPIIRIVNEPFMVQGSLRGGWTDFYTGQVTLALARNAKHEFVHYTLLRLGFDWNLNATHQSRAFNDC